jgi:hypothetical protein
MAWRRGRGGWGGRGGYWGPINVPYAIAPVYNPLAPGTVQNITPEDQVAMLKQEKEYLDAEIKEITKAMDDINKRISELEKKE